MVLLRIRCVEASCLVLGPNLRHILFQGAFLEGFDGAT